MEHTFLGGSKLLMYSIIHEQSAGVVWLNLVRRILENGEVCSPRKKRIKEIMSSPTAVAMSWPATNIVERKLGKRFMCAEAAWILSGDNRVETIRNYSPAISNFSDDGRYFKGAYGPKIVDQLMYVVDVLMADVDTRQAVLNIWRENPRTTKDVPCTISIQWLIRNGRLHCVDTMRSSDAWLGWPYDIFNFSMLSGFILLMIQERCERAGIPLSAVPGLGNIYLNAGSQHLYEDQWEPCHEITKGYTCWTYMPFDPLTQFISPTHLVEHLWRLANKDRSLWHDKTQWLVPQIVPGPTEEDVAKMSSVPRMPRMEEVTGPAGDPIWVPKAA
jgi:thymidylate synthase